MKNNISKISSISVVAPARNEAENIIQFFAITAKTLDKITKDWEIIVINDNSFDNTKNILNSLKKSHQYQLRVLTNRRRLGVTASLWKGISIATKDIIVFLPTDLESNPHEDIPKLIDALSKGSDFVIGWRQKKRVGLIKSITTAILHYLSKFLFHLDIHDPSWIKAFRREIVRDIPGLRSDWQKFFAIIVHWRGFQVNEVKTNWYPRKYGRSNFGRFGLGRIPTSFFDLLNLWFILNFSKKPMHIFGTSGITLFIIGFNIGLYIVYSDYILLVDIKRRIPLIIFSTLLIFTGIQLLAIGFLAELFISTKSSNQNE